MAFSAIPDSIAVDVRIPEVRAIPVAPGVAVPQAQPNPVANGDNPVAQPQSNRPTQINLVIDNTRRVGTTEVKEIRRETVLIENDGRVVV